MRFVLDTCIMIDWLRNDPVAVDAVVLASSKGSVFVSLISIMELYLSNKKKSQIERDVSAIKTLCCRWGSKYFLAPALFRKPR